MPLRQAALRAVSTAVIVLTAVAAAVLWPPSPARASLQTHIAVIGDSYTTGSDEGGNGSNSWPAVAWQLLADRGVDIDADIAAEGGAGYGRRGNGGSVFEDLAAQAVQQDDDLVVFFGSRNDQPVDPGQFPDLASGAFQWARLVAPTAKFLVIGPPWPTAVPPPSLLTIRDTLRAQAAAVDAVFIDPIAERWFVDRPDLIGDDGVHPTDAGHAYLAQRIAALIHDQLTILV